MGNKKSVDVVIFTDCSTKLFTRYAGAYSLATVLRKHGYSVQVIDHFLLAGLETTLSIIDKFVGSNTLFVGFATTFMNLSTEHIPFPGSFKFRDTEKTGGGARATRHSRGIPISDAEMDSIRNKIKNINPKTHLVMGGTKANLLAQRQMDAFIIGNADNSVIEYAKFLQGNNPFFQYKLIHNKQMVVDYDIQATGFDFSNSMIEYHDTDMIEPNEILAIEPARGCIFKCKFCSFPLIGKKKNDHIKHKDVIYAELMRNYEKFGTTKYIFADDTHNESVEKLEHLAEAFRKLPFKLEFATYLRHDLIHRFPEMADLLKESGLKVAMFGIETLNHEAGKIIGKGLHPEKTRETLHWLRDDKGWKNNILMSSGFIVGLPTETRDTVNKWAEELMDFKYPLDSFNFFSLHIGQKSLKGTISEFERDYKKYGYYFDPKISKGWINSTWKIEDADTMANQLHKYVFGIGRSKTYGFYGMMLHNFGYTWNDVHNYSWTELIQRQSTFGMNLDMANRYYDRILTC